MILDYTNYIIVTDHVEASGSHHREISSTIDHENLYGFLHKENWCPYCKIKIPTVHHIHDHPASLSDFINTIWACPECGFWSQLRHFSSVKRMADEHRSAILRKYNESDKEIPIDTLNKYLNKNPSLLYGINPLKMEKLVQAVFSSFFNCDIHHCGRSHDEGIDLYYVDSENPVAIQVKRREKPNFVEPVSSIREFLGAVMLSNFSGAIYVTTANHFSKEAQQVRVKAVKRDLVKSFELYDFKRFISMLKLEYSDNKEPWRRFIDLGIF
jgi:restriction system protein